MAPEKHKPHGKERQSQPGKKDSQPKENPQASDKSSRDLRKAEKDYKYYESLIRHNRGNELKPDQWAFVKAMRKEKKGKSGKHKGEENSSMSNIPSSHSSSTRHDVPTYYPVAHGSSSHDFTPSQPWDQEAASLPESGEVWPGSGDEASGIVYEYPTYPNHAQTGLHYVKFHSDGDQDGSNEYDEGAHSDPGWPPRK